MEIDSPFYSEVTACKPADLRFFQPGSLLIEWGLAESVPLHHVAELLSERFHAELVTNYLTGQVPSLC